MKRSQKVSSGFDPTGGNRAAAPLHIPLARGPLSAGLPCDVLNVCDSITVAARWACLHALQGWRPKCTVYERVLVQCEKWVELAGHQINPPRAFDAEQQMCPNARPCISTSFKGQANLHVFEDWCGSSIAQLRRNLHFPLYPHTRTTVKKLAVAPKWKNYGLRIFGFLHPYRDGDFQFSVSSDDNSEFWLSPDESPLNARLLVYVGQLGTEWTAPGEFSKFRSQASKSVHLISSRRYYFEILHKQDDKGSDHVEVGWRPFLPGLKYEVIDSAYISLYTDESSLKMNGVDHIPQTLASHIRLPEASQPQGLEAGSSTQHGADMLKPDPRDTFYSTPMIDPARLENVLPACLYSPTYVVKDFPIARYQGLQFVYLSFVYPNDFTRHHFCFSPLESSRKIPRDNSNKLAGSKKEENKIYITRPRAAKEREREQRRERREERSYRHPREVFPGVFLYQTGKTTRLVNLGAKGRIAGGVTGGRNPVSAPKLWPNPPTKEDKTFPHNGSINSVQKSARRAAVANRPEKSKRKGEHQDLKTTVTADLAIKGVPLHPLSHHQDPLSVTVPRLKSTEDTLGGQSRVTSYLRISEITESQQQPDPDPNPAELDQDTNRSNPDPDPDPEPEPEPEPEEGEISDYSYEEVEARPGWAEESINWQRTFSVNPMDFELLRSDWNDLRCNVSGNLQLAESEVVDVIYTLLRIINVEKRRDSARGNRYLVELELMERGRSVVRLSEYIYLLLHRGRQGEESLENTDSAPASATAYAKPLLCQPVMLQWRRDVMVHFVVPVKNQARWVQQFISDMENLHRQTKDDNFSIIIVDFESEDMDVEQALRESSYLRREGNFERSAGLQIGVDTIEDSHSIVFLCDLHIHFPLNILESIRKHCVEGRLAFAPIVMRLGCGSSPQEPDGYWEVNGFGLFGIYKSDFEKIGGMNTEEFKDRWGGEDWELLDRVLQNGLEVERLRLRNFFHYYHSKRGMWNAQNKKTPKG
uniref:Beta-1,4-N-acetylgalactosaminyltransferase n=1 Tax=Scophthalmus maximus TaxID=52904 RepID=A0A8D3A9J5_SCOMX